jgi:flagellar FliJ protein
VDKRFPLQSILDLSQLRLDQSTRKLGELIASEQQASERLQLLIQYRDEYHGRFLAAARDGLSPEEWRNYQHFLEKLDTAIGQATEMMARSKENTSAGQKDWLNKRGRVKAFDTLAQRHQAQVHYAEARQEQKAVDERAARNHTVQSDENQA